MLRKSLAFGLLAAVMVAPTAALADQVAGSNSFTNQSSTNRGWNNTNGSSSTTNTVQKQISRSGSGFCSGGKAGNQTAAASSETNQISKNRGVNNVNGNTSNTDTIQKQVANRISGSLCR